ncbi:hypothetical protein QJQ45_004921 [Haematococcus lacustris]|nr:hypothetical protein QJQ45_004921 [Haematococcus lacustris]
MAASPTATMDTSRTTSTTTSQLGRLGAVSCDCALALRGHLVGNINTRMAMGAEVRGLLQQVVSDDRQRKLKHRTSTQFEVPVLGLMWCPWVNLDTLRDLGIWVDRDCTSALNLHWSGEATWRSVELCW